VSGTGDSNIQRYVGNDPVNCEDPSGHFKVKKHLIPDKENKKSKDPTSAKMNHFGAGYDFVWEPENGDRNGAVQRVTVAASLVVRLTNGDAYQVDLTESYVEGFAVADRRGKTKKLRDNHIASPETLAKYLADRGKFRFDQSGSKLFLRPRARPSEPLEVSSWEFTTEAEFQLQHGWWRADRGNIAPFDGSQQAGTTVAGEHDFLMTAVVGEQTFTTDKGHLLFPENETGVPVAAPAFPPDDPDSNTPRLISSDKWKMSWSQGGKVESSYTGGYK
jgi:hypothetical protein